MKNCKFGLEKLMHALAGAVFLASLEKLMHALAGVVFVANLEKLMHALAGVFHFLLFYSNSFSADFNYICDF